MKIHFSICYWTGDWKGVVRLHREIKERFPLASISFVPDGITPLNLIGVPHNEQLKPINGGAWLERIFQTCPSHCDLFFKVEPDITFNRVPTHWSSGDWFGHLSRPIGSIRPLLRGGFWGLSQSKVQEILESGFLRDDLYLSDRYKYDRYGKFLLPDEEPGPMIYHCDSIMAAVCDRLGIKPTHWNEIYLNFREPSPSDIDKFAIVTKSIKRNSQNV
jgi:hypothetical protein